jgi:hypothetical protein
MSSIGSRIMTSHVDCYHRVVILWMNRDPTGRAKCRRCRAHIAKGALRVQWREEFPVSDFFLGYLHLHCAIDLDARGVARVLELFKEWYERQFPERYDLEWILAKRMRAIEECRKPVHQRDPAVLDVQPVRDPQGRPRMRVLLTGNAICDRALPRHYRLCAGEWASSKREYKLLLQRSGVENPEEDPSQPLIGAVFAPYADSKLMEAQWHRLQSWAARGLPTPVLWIFSRGTRDRATDEQIVRWRAVLDDIGFRGDEAKVVETRRLDAPAMDALVEALDETFECHEIPTLDVSPEDIALAAFAERLADEGHTIAVQYALRRAAWWLDDFSDADLEALWRLKKSNPRLPVSAEGRRAFARLAARMLSFEMCRDDALVLLERCMSEPLWLELDPLVEGAVRSAIERFALDPKQRLTQRVERLLAFAARQGVRERGAPLVSAMQTATTPARVAMLARALELARDPDADAALLVWYDTARRRKTPTRLLESLREIVLRRSLR